MNKIENETLKYKKKKESSTSKSKTKSKHKHEYIEQCIIKYPTPYLKRLNGKEFSTSIATYCKHCGKVGHLERQITDEEMSENFKDLEIIEVDDVFVKYIPISKGDD